MPPRESSPDLRQPIPEEACEAPRVEARNVRRRVPIGADAGQGFLLIRRVQSPAPIGRTLLLISPAGFPWRNPWAPNRGDCDPRRNGRATNREYPNRDRRDQPQAEADG